MRARRVVRYGGDDDFVVSSVKEKVETSLELAVCSQNVVSLAAQYEMVSGIKKNE